MSIIYAGGVTSSSKNLWKFSFVDDTLSLVTSADVGATVNALTIDGSSTYLYVGTNQTVRRHKTSDLSLDTSWATNGIFTCNGDIGEIAIDRNDYCAIAHESSGTKTVRLLNASGTEVWGIEVYGEKAHSIFFTPDGNVLVGIENAGVSASVGRLLKRIDGSVIQSYFTQYADSKGRGICCDVKKNSVYLASCDNDYPGSHVRRLNYITDSPIWNVDIAGSNVYAGILHTNEDYYVAIASYDDCLVRLDSTDGTELASYDSNNYAYAIAEDEDGNLLLGTGQTNSNPSGKTVSLSVFDEDLNYITGYDTGERIYAVASSNENTVFDVVPFDKNYSKSLVAFGNGEVWYGSSLGTMTKWTAVDNEYDPFNPFSVVEAFQKLFIVNETNLKVADFTNTKINTADAGAVVCHKGNTLTGETSGAKMVIDYVDAVTDGAAMNVYGYRYTTATFSSGETVTGTNDDGDTISFTTSAAETAPPHWYDWTVFGNDTTNYGELPTSATLIALYRGRLIVNDNHNPHAWKMLKVGDPWKALYDFTNDGDLSAVSHANNKVGLLGDILTALISYKDDLFIFGCANSVWALIGDPLASGQLAEITHATGIWGSRSWCFDGDSNLYFLGEHGIYRMPIGETVGPPENISKLRLPNLISDLDLDKSLHRVVLGFDPESHGINIYKTTLDGGSNTNYFFSLFTQGFYPETYPDSCGVFSAYYYPATDDTYKKYLVGCADGYIREFDSATKNDATTSSTTAIDSYFATVGQLAEDEDFEGKLNWLTAITSGGAANGNFGDTDTIDYSLFSADDAETVLEDIIDGATAFTTGTWTGPGKANKVRVRMRGAWYGLKVQNDTASETWGLNKIYGDRSQAGKIKG